MRTDSTSPEPFFKNMVNSQRTCGVIVEQVMGKQYRIGYGDNQHTKVTTNNREYTNIPPGDSDPNKQ